MGSHTRNMASVQIRCYVLEKQKINDTSMMLSLRCYYLHNKASHLAAFIA